MSKRPPPIPGRPAPTTSEKKYCKATWDYNANEPGELNFKIGDIITIVTEDPSGWWVGELNGQKGQFPLNFTEVYTPAPSVPKPTRATPSPEPTPVTEVKSAPSPIGGGGDPMAELRAKLANRSTIAPGELSPVKKEVEPTETSTPHKINLKPADSSGPSRAVKDNNPRAASMISSDKIIKPPTAARSPRGSDLTSSANNIKASSLLRSSDNLPEEEKPVLKPVLNKVTKPQEEKPVEKVVEKPALKPVSNNNNKVITKPQEEKPVEKVVEKPVLKPVSNNKLIPKTSEEKPVEKAAEKAEKAIEKHILKASPQKHVEKSETPIEKPTLKSISRDQNNNNIKQINNNNVKLSAGSPSPSPSAPLLSSSSSRKIDSPLPGNLGEFGEFCTVLIQFFDQLKNNNKGGELFSNHLLLQRAEKNHFGFSFYSVLGHRFSFGDSSVHFCLHDAVNPLIHAISSQELGKAKLAALIGKAKGTNACTDAASLISTSNLQTPEIVSLFQKYFSSLINSDFDYDLPTYLVGQSNHDDLFATAYLLSSQNVLGKNNSIQDLIDQILQLRSIRLNCEKAASLAASFASDSNSNSNSNSISLISDEVSKEFQTLLKKQSPNSLPVIKSISGALIAIIPNVGGLALYSPLLNDQNISVKSLEFCNLFISKFSL